MKLSMEIMYVPVANIHQKREMISDWRFTSDNASKFSLVAALVSVLATISMKFFGDEFYFIFLGSGALYLLSALFCKKWYFSAYISVIVAWLVTCSWASFGLSKDDIPEILCFAVVCIMQFIPIVYSCRCLYNYAPVFKELKKCKGFPNFIANTADIYGDKMHIKDEPVSNKAQASHNPFNTQKDIQAEEFRREQDLKIRAKSKPLEQAYESSGSQERVRIEQNIEYKYGFSILGREIKFLHNDIPSSSFEEKKRLMSQWNHYLKEAERDFFIPLFLMMVSIMGAGFGSFMGFIMYAFIPLYIMFFNYLKTSKAFAPYGIFVVVAMYLSCVMNNFMSAGLAVGFLILSRRVWVACIMSIINRPIYKALSKEEGFPSFIRNTADLYGDKAYIVEKREPIKRRILSDDEKIVMNIGFDEEPKKEEKAWNAFDYMDEEKDEKNEN
ncbi:MAG: hypothetical protein E7529_02510 [Ruminococcaceae bacterium]|nr:hypothetical protein [Oscillospiraceae bacterium]